MLASPPEYEDLVAEIYFEGKFLGQLVREGEGNGVSLELADHACDQRMICRKVAIVGFLDAIRDAFQKLTGESLEFSDESGE